MTGICIAHLNKVYKSRSGDVPALLDINLDIGDGEFVAIIGPSGCGKSTLLYILGGFIPADGGTMAVGGKAIAGPGTDRGIVFQEYALFPWLTVEAEHLLRARDGRHGAPRARADRRRSDPHRRSGRVSKTVFRANCPAA